MGELRLRGFHFQTDIMTRAELAFGALDRNKKGFITAKEGQWEGRRDNLYLFCILETFLRFTIYFKL